MVTRANLDNPILPTWNANANIAMRILILFADYLISLFSF